MQLKGLSKTSAGLGSFFAYRAWFAVVVVAGNDCPKRAFFIDDSSQGAWVVEARRAPTIYPAAEESY